MNAEKKSQGIFISFIFICSFLLWGLSIFLSLKHNIRLIENAELLNSLLNGTLNSEYYKIIIINTLAGYGPLFGTILVTALLPETRKYFENKFKWNTPLKYILQIIALFLSITIILIVPIAFRSGFDTTITWSLVNLLLLFFIYQFITAGTEEIAWRGFLLPLMLKKKTPWQASVRIGVIWALWHTPIILYVFYSQGLHLIQILISFIGFIAGTIAMSTIHTYYYLKTNNILFNMFIHAISNTLPMFVGMVFASSYEISVFVQILLWVFVLIITKKNKVLFDSVQDQDLL